DHEYPVVTLPSISIVADWPTVSAIGPGSVITDASSPDSEPGAALVGEAAVVRDDEPSSPHPARGAAAATTRKVAAARRRAGRSGSVGIPMRRRYLCDARGPRGCPPEEEAPFGRSSGSA